EGRPSVYCNQRFQIMLADDIRSRTRRPPTGRLSRPNTPDRFSPSGWRMLSSDQKTRHLEGPGLPSDRRIAMRQHLATASIHDRKTRSQDYGFKPFPKIQGNCKGASLLSRGDQTLDGE